MNARYLSTAADLAEAAAGIFVQEMRTAIESRGRFLVALSGGSTPRPVHERLAQPPHSSLPWDRAEIYFGDERMAPCDSPESNYHMACETLLDHVDIPPWNVHRIQGELNPDEAARLYDRELHDLAVSQEDGGERAGNGAPPAFDLIFLGLGPDGHTASLFPSTSAPDRGESAWGRLAAAVHLPSGSEGSQHAVDRVTMTYPVLNAARRVVFLVAGDDKTRALELIAAGDKTLPAARVKPTTGELLWLIVQSR